MKDLNQNSNEYNGVVVTSENLAVSKSNICNLHASDADGCYQPDDD